MLISRVTSISCFVGTFLLWGVLIWYWPTLSSKAIFTLFALSWFMAVASFMFGRLALYFEIEALQQAMEKSAVQRGLHRILNKPHSTEQVKAEIHAGLYSQDERPLLPSQAEIQISASRLGNQNRRSTRYEVPELAASNLSKKV